MLPACLKERALGDFSRQDQKVIKGLKVKLVVPKKNYSLGQAVPLILTVKNISGRKKTFTFSSAQNYDFLVRSAGGKLIWQWSKDKFFAQVLQDVTLEPKEGLRFEEEWSQKDQSGNLVKKGRYRIMGTLKAQDYQKHLVVEIFIR